MNFVIVYCILSGERSTRYRLEVVTRHHRVLFLLHHLLSSQVCLFQQPCGITFLIASVSLVRADGGGAAAFCMQVRNVYTHLHPLRMKSCTAAGTARLRFSVGREGGREGGRSGILQVIYVVAISRPGVEYLIRHLAEV